MTRNWRRRSADWREAVGAIAVGAGVGVATFYLARLLLARDEVPTPERPGGRPATEPPEDRDRGER